MFLLQNVIQFAAAADAYAAASGLKDWFVLYFQFGQSIELLLKAFAISAGATEKILIKKLGHDLSAALAYAEKNGLVVEGGISDQDRVAIKLVGKWHEEQITRYPLMQGYAIPNPIVVRTLLDRLLKTVFCHIWSENDYVHAVQQEKTLGLNVDIRSIYDGSWTG